MERYFSSMSSFPPGGFYVSGSTETLIEVSKYECNIKSSIKLEFVIQFVSPVILSH